MHNEFPADPQMRRNLNAQVPWVQGAEFTFQLKTLGQLFKLSLASV